MKLKPGTAIPMAVVIALSAGLIVALAATRPDDRRPGPAAAASPPAPTATPTATASPTVTRTPTPTSTPRPPTVGAATPTAPPAAGEPVESLSGLRFLQVTVVENPRALPVVFPPDMPIEVLVGIRRDLQQAAVSFYMAPPPPFPPMLGATVIGAAFSEDGGTARATGTGPFDGAQATFTFDFEISPRRLAGTVRIVDTAGATVLVMSWTE